MTDELKPEGEQKEVVYPHILIQVMPDGGITVSGSINDKVLAYGLLVYAKDEITKHIDKQLEKQAVESIIRLKKNGHRFPNLFKHS